MSSSHKSTFSNEGLKLASYCPVCETRFNAMEAQVVDQERDTHLVHVTCRKCKHGVLSLVLVNASGSSSVGLLTDLSYEDALALKQAKRIGVNDVIDVHEQLDQVRFSDLGGKEKRPASRRIRSRSANKQASSGQGAERG